MPISYKTAKAAAIDLVDDFTDIDVTSAYGPQAGAKYSAKTKLDKLQVNSIVRATMPPRVNKVMQKLCGPDSWRLVGSVDMVMANTIGDVILLVCGHSGAVVPEGEPR